MKKRTEQTHSSNITRAAVIGDVAVRDLFVSSIGRVRLSLNHFKNLTKTLIVKKNWRVFSADINISIRAEMLDQNPSFIGKMK